MHLSDQGLLVILVVGIIAGWLAGRIIRGNGFGLVGDAAIGIVGALIGDWLLHRLGTHFGSGIIGLVINATIGAALQIARISPAFSVHSRHHFQHLQRPAPSHLPPHAPRPQRRSVPDLASRHRGLSPKPAHPDCARPNSVLVTAPSHLIRRRGYSLATETFQPANDTTPRRPTGARWRPASAASAILGLVQPASVKSTARARSDTDIIFDLAVRLGLGEHFWNGDVEAAYRHQLAPSGLSPEALQAEPRGTRVPLPTAK